MGRRNCFNSILVRLKDEVRFTRYAHGGIEFQFHTGSIKSVMTMSNFPCIVCFNSILVRLKVKRVGSPCGAVGLLFQFHTGSIKSESGIILPRTVYKFQFHTGSIKSLSKSTQAYIDPKRFNSILVRLKAWRQA